MDLPPLPAEAGFTRIREALFLQRLEGPGDVASEEASAIGDAGLRRFPAGLGDVPEPMEVDEDTLSGREVQAFRCGPVYLSVRPLILTLSGDGNYREHFIYRRLGCEFIIRCPPGGHCMKVI